MDPLLATVPRRLNPEPRTLNPEAPLSVTGPYSLDTTRFLLPEKESLAQHTVGVLFGTEHQHRLSLSEPVRKARCKRKNR